MGLKLEQQFLIEDFNRNIENANLEEAKFLLKHLYKTTLEQKNHYLELMQHHWFKPKQEPTLLEQIESIKAISDKLFNQVLLTDTPVDWTDSDVQNLFCLLEAIDYFLDEFYEHGKKTTTGN